MIRRVVMVLLVLVVAGCKTEVAATDRLKTAAVEQSLRSFHSKQKDAFVELIGVHQENQQTATAYYVFRRKNKKQHATARILNLLDKGWHLSRIDYGVGFDKKWWSFIFVKIE